MFKKYFFIIVSLLAITISSYSQGPISNKEISKMEKELKEEANIVVGAEENFVIGDKLFKIGKYQSALNIFEKNLNENKNLFGAATSARFVNNDKSAVKYYTQLIERNANIDEAYFGRALAYRKLEEYEKSIRDLSEYLEKNESNEYAYAGLGDLYILINRNEEAKRILEKGSEKFPNSALIKSLLVKAYKKS
ncbi:MAG: tetratricopeptide repeat protein [Fusobacteriaceae bacterium]